MSLPIFIVDNKNMSMMQTTWASQLNPLLSNPLSNGLVLQNLQLITGSNVVNHLLGRKLQGWVIIRQRGPATFYDTQDGNTMPNLTLYLTSSAAVSVDLYVF